MKSGNQTIPLEVQYPLAMDMFPLQFDNKENMPSRLRATSESTQRPSKQRRVVLGDITHGLNNFQTPTISINSILSNPFSEKDLSFLDDL